MRKLNLAQALTLAALHIAAVAAFTPDIEKGFKISKENLKIFELRPADDGKIFRAPKEDAALQRLLTSNPPTRASTSALFKLQAYFASIDAIHGDSVAGVKPECSDRDYWAHEALYYLKLRGVAGNHHCVTLTRQSPKHLPDLAALSKELKEKYAKSFADAAVGNWSSAILISGADNVNGALERCTLHKQAAFRINGKWFLEFTFTNLAASVRNVTRDLLTEYIHVTDSSSAVRFRSMATYIRNRTTNNMTTAATVLYRRRVYPGSSTFGAPSAGRNVALQAAMRMADDDVSTASDTTQLSNMAILVVPLTLNLVPVALIADVNAAGMLLYTLITDVITALPLAIKGAELLDIATREPRRAAASYLAGLPDASRYHGVAELFVAECTAGDSVRTTAVALLAASAFFMVFGIALEFIARYCVRKRAECCDSSTSNEAGTLLAAREMRKCVCTCHSRLVRRRSDCNSPALPGGSSLRSTPGLEAQCGADHPVEYATFWMQHDGLDKRK